MLQTKPVIFSQMQNCCFPIRLTSSIYALYSTGVKNKAVKPLPVALAGGVNCHDPESLILTWAIFCLLLR
jgi:hypothetical protein